MPIAYLKPHRSVGGGRLWPMTCALAPLRPATRLRPCAIHTTQPILHKRLWPFPPVDRDLILEERGPLG